MGYEKGKAEMHGERKSVTAWAQEDGISGRTARNWVNKVAVIPGSRDLKFGIRVSKGIVLNKAEWEIVKAKGKGVPGIKKGHKYPEGRGKVDES